MPGQLCATWLGKFLPVGLLVGVLLGCGETGTHVSGKVTYKGQPVPTGSVIIEPDASAGNSGPPGYAEITNGTYDTQLEGGRAATPGAVVMRIEGLDPTPPPNAGPEVTTTLLFTGYEKKVELPATPSVQDIEVPAEASQRRSRPEGSAGGPITP